MRSRLLIALAVLLVGCGDTVVDPFQNDGRYYTVWGFIDANEDSHKIRVIPVTRLPATIETPSDEAAQIDAVVTTTDLARGTEVIWTHSLEQLADSTWAHIYRANFNVRDGARYRLEVRRSDGVTATAETRVPAFTAADMARWDTVTVAADGRRQQKITIDGIATPYAIQMIYQVEAPIPLKRFRELVDYDQQGARTPDGGWSLYANLDRDMPIVRQRVIDWLPPQERKLLGVSAMGVRVTAISEGWDPPEGIFDPDLLIVPGAISNIQNGYGFFGSVNFYEQEWPVSNEFSMSFGYEF